VILWGPSKVKVCEQVAGLRTPAVRVLGQKVVPGTAKSLNETEPDCGTAVPGKPAPVFAGVTVAVKITGELRPTMLRFEVTVVAEGASPTVCETLATLPSVKFASPL